MPRTVLAVAHRIRRRARRGLRSAAGQGYRYDAQGRRVRSDVGGAQRRYSLYAQDGRLLWQRDEVAGTRSVDVYLAGSLVAEVRRPLVGTTASVGFLHTDPLGSPIAKTDATGAVVETSEYEPYGLLLNRANDDRVGYTGHVMDSATGLTYMQQRYYDPAIGRFLSVDPVTAYSNPVGAFNRYWYAANNPYKFTDPDGRAVRVGGADADQNELIQQTQRFTGMVVTQDSNGMLQSSQCTVDQSSASPVAADALMSAINSPDTINLTAVNSVPSVLGDDYASGRVDVADINGFASQSPQMGAAVLTHVLTEYQTAQAMPGGQNATNFPAAHAAALGVESQVFGAANRTNSASAFAPGGTISFDYRNAAGVIVQSFNYTFDQNMTPN